MATGSIIPPDDRKLPTRDRYGFALPLPTRWMDNDIYGHVNNVVYYAYFDTVINRYLIDRGGLDIVNGPVIGVCAQSKCRYVAPSAYPEILNGCLGVWRLGRSSVTYDLAIFAADGELRAFGHFVHVFVSRGERKPVAIPDVLRSALQILVVSHE